MKTQQTTVIKMMARFDNELKSLLINDLSSVRNKKTDLLNIIQNNLNNRLKAA